MGGKGGSKRARLESYLAERGLERIGLGEMEELRAALGPVSDSYLRKLLRATGVPLDALVDGVRQGSYDELEQSLLALEREYSGGDAETRRRARELVIEAKAHARWALRRGGGGDAAERAERIAWMLTWLENPPAFPAWVALRRHAMAASSRE